MTLPSFKFIVVALFLAPNFVQGEDSLAPNSKKEEEPLAPLSNQGKGSEGAVMEFKIHECNSDADCYEGFFCFESVSGRFCSSCRNCKLDYSRQNGGTNCARNHHECGQCLPEFKEQKLTKGGVKSKCFWAPDEAPTGMPVGKMKIIPEATSSSSSDNLTWMIVLVSLAMLFFGVLIGVAGYKAYLRFCSRGRCDRNRMREASPEEGRLNQEVREEEN